MTATLGQENDGRSGIDRSSRDVAGMSSARTRSISLGMVGLLALVISAWGGIIPYLGSAFGFSADGTPSWHWNLSHAVLALIPGAIGLLFGLSLMVRTGPDVALRRLGLTAGGLLAIAGGAWFVIGPLAWPVLVSNGHYFVGASPLRELEYQVGYALGPGLILAACGAFAIGWAARHNRPLGSGARPATTPGSVRQPVDGQPPISPDPGDPGSVPPIPPPQ